ncbi:MAG: hypothetical protein FWC56_00475 [Phycisphaerae bacterium]|nr:hypothetical protein [Phycisphaerae bacterium]
MVKVNSGDRRRYWQELIQRQQASGQSIESFCDKEKLGQSSFYAWKRRLRKVGKISKAARTPARKELVPVQIVNDRPNCIVNNRLDDRPVSTANLEVQWPDGVLLRVQGCEVQVVKAIVATISASSKRRGQPC